MAKRPKYEVGSIKQADPDDGGGVLGEFLHDQRVTGGPPTSALLEELISDPDNPRSHLGDLDELADSLRAQGQLQPVTVAPRDVYLKVKPQHAETVAQARFVVLYGQRRLEAARIAELDRVLIHVAESPRSAAEVLSRALVENVQRKDFEPLEEAKAVAELVTLHGNQGEVAQQLGKSQGWVSQRLTLLNLAPELQDQLRNRDITVREARELGRLSHEKQVAARHPGYYPVIDPGGERSPSGEKGASPNGASARSAPTARQKSAGPPSATAPVPASSAPTQLTLELQWEPRTMAGELQARLGQERFAALAAEMTDLL